MMRGVHRRILSILCKHFNFWRVWQTVKVVPMAVDFNYVDLRWHAYWVSLQPLLAAKSKELLQPHEHPMG
jgi:hypothetical protein